MYVIYVHKYAILTFFCAVVPTYMHTIRRSCHTSWTNTHIHKTRLETLICTQCNSLFGFWISFFSLLCFVVRLFSLFYIQISRVFVRFWRKEKHAAKKTHHLTFSLKQQQSRALFSHFFEENPKNTHTNWTLSMIFFLFMRIFHHWTIFIHRKHFRKIVFRRRCFSFLFCFPFLR